jgi:hypothetical protein
VTLSLPAAPARTRGTITIETPRGAHELTQQNNAVRR